MQYVLVIILQSMSGNSIAMHDFNTIGACEKAMEAVLIAAQEDPDNGITPNAICLPKGAPIRR